MKVLKYFTLVGAFKLLACVLFMHLATILEAQLIFKTKFSAIEGYTNGWIIGQPSVGNKWMNANADWDWVNANEPSPGSYSPLNNGKSWTPEGATEPWYIVTATNCTAPEGGAMMIASDGNFGTNAATYFWKMDFPNQMVGPITVTWDWQFRCTNTIPADYDPTNNNYNALLPGFDHGFGLADWANKTADGDIGNPNWKYSELSTGVRLSSRQDCRYNGLGIGGGGGSWFDRGPEFKDGKVLHMKTIMYLSNGANGDPQYANSYDNFAQRDGEAVWQTAKHDGNPDYEDALGAKPMEPFGMRRLPGEKDPTSGINCIMCWMNGNQFSRCALVSNIRIVGPNPVPAPKLSIDKAGKVTFEGWLEAADKAEGPYNLVAVQSPYTIPSGTTAKFYRASN